jgi:hypothetical protein
VPRADCHDRQELAIVWPALHILHFHCKDCSKIPSLKAKRLCTQQQQQQQQQKQQLREDEWDFGSFDTLVEVKEFTGKCIAKENVYTLARGFSNM